MRPELTQAADLLRLNTPEAVEEAIGLLQNTVYSFSMKVCGHPEDAEDTTQEVLFSSLEHLARIKDPQALAVWLYTVKSLLENAPKTGACPEAYSLTG
jgi:RNA polymerase sigma-70 factor (ECF subfamily)